MALVLNGDTLFSEDSCLVQDLTPCWRGCWQCPWPYQPSLSSRDLHPISQIKARGAAVLSALPYQIRCSIHLIGAGGGRRRPSFRQPCSEFSLSNKKHIPRWEMPPSCASLEGSPAGNWGEREPYVWGCIQSGGEFLCFWAGQGKAWMSLGVNVTGLCLSSWIVILLKSGSAEPLVLSHTRNGTGSVFPKILPDYVQRWLYHMKQKTVLILPVQ